MKIGIDARLAGLENRGIGRYLENLIKNLEKFDTNDQFYIFLSQKNYFRYQFKKENFKKVLTKFRWYSFSEQIFFPLLIKKYKIDLMHFPHFNVPLLINKKYIVTLHDLTLIHFPNRRASTLPVVIYKIKYKLFKFIQKRILRKAKKIITPSFYVKNDLINYYKLDQNKIKVIYEGCKINNYDNFDFQEILKKFSIKKPFILYIGAAYPHKNLERLVRVFKIVNKDKKYQLVIGGRIDYFMKRLKNRVARVGENKDDIIFTNFLRDKELITLYQQAQIFVFPSLSEGFGLPGLEAQVYKLPVAASNQSCLKEILGKGALYFNPLDNKEMIYVINKVLNDKLLRKKMIKSGQANTEKFSWLNMIQETMSIYHSFDLEK